MSIKRIIIAEGVPLRNKGEEAIIRGIVDILFDAKDEVEVAVLDYVDKPEYFNDIKVFPFEWLYPYHRPFRTKVLNLKPLTFLQNVKRKLDILLMPLGYLGAAKCLLSQNRKYRYKKELAEYVKTCDYVFLGHDGAWGLQSCPVLIACYKLGKKVGILGSGFNKSNNLISFYISKIMYKKAIKYADYAYFRENNSFKLMQYYNPRNIKVKLAPDPAFGMIPENHNVVLGYLKNIKFIRETLERKKDIILVTVCENSIIFDKSFLWISDEKKKSEHHSRILASILDSLVKHFNTSIVFLPHTIDVGRGNDITISKEVLSRMTEKKNSFIIEDDLSAKMLKGIIGTCDFLIGERTHSLIGAISVGTPFIALTNSYDTRTHDIIGDMCRSNDLVLDINVSTEILKERVSAIYSKKDSYKNRLTGIKQELDLELSNIRKHIIG